MVRYIRKVADICGLTAGYASGFVLLLMAVVMFYEVVARRAGHPTLWVSEFTGYFFLWSVMVGATYTQYQNGHVRVEMLAERLPRKAQVALELAALVIGIIYCAVLVWVGWDQVMNSYALGKVSNSPMRIPLYPVELGIPVGALLVLIQLLCKLILREFRQPAS